MSGAIPPAEWPATKRAVCLEYPDTPEWTALITGVLLQLSFGYYWDKNYSNWEAARTEGQNILMSWFKQIACNAGAIPVLEPQCEDYPNNSPILDWQPANPFLSPGYIPPGYIAQPWGVVGDPPVLTYQPGDVISGLFGLPVLTPALGQGLARVRIRFAGEGTVEVHLIKVAFGGLALLTWDDNPFTATFVDTSMDFLAIPPESGDEDIQEITFSTPGDHHIDVTMLPKFTTEAGFIGYGGGIRQIVLCGPDIRIVDRPPESGIIDQFPGPDSPAGEGENVAICDVLRYNNGVLQVWCCNEWQDVPAIGTGAPGNPSQPPPSSPPALNECFSYKVSLDAKNQWLLPFPVNAGDTLEIFDAVGGWNDGTLGWFCPNGKVYEFGACAADQPGEMTDPMPSLNHMQIVGLLGTGSDYFDPMSGVYVVPVGTVDQQLSLQANDGTLDDNTGTIQFTVKVCHKETETWCYEWDSTAEAGPFVPFNDGTTSYGIWVSGAGWKNGVTAGGAQLSLIANFDSTGCNHIEFDVTCGTPIVAPQHLDVYADDGGTTLHTEDVVSGVVNVVWDGDPQSSILWLNAFNFEADPNLLIITRIKMSGFGAPPLGPSTC